MLAASQMRELQVFKHQRAQDLVLSGLIQQHVILHLLVFKSQLQVSFRTVSIYPVGTPEKHEEPQGAGGQGATQKADFPQSFSGFGEWVWVVRG